MPHLTLYFLLQASVALNSIEWQADVYPMDFYSADSLGPWAPNYKEGEPRTAVKIEEKCAPKDDCGTKECNCAKKT